MRFTEDNATQYGQRSGVSRTLMSVRNRLRAIPEDVPIKPERLAEVRAEVERLERWAS